MAPIASAKEMAPAAAAAKTHPDRKNLLAPLWMLEDDAEGSTIADVDSDYSGDEEETTHTDEYTYDGYSYDGSSCTGYTGYSPDGEEETVGEETTDSTLYSLGGETLQSTWTRNTGTRTTSTPPHRSNSAPKGATGRDVREGSSWYQRSGGGKPVGKWLGYFLGEDTIKEEEEEEEADDCETLYSKGYDDRTVSTAGGWTATTMKEEEREAVALPTSRSWFDSMKRYAFNEIGDDDESTTAHGSTASTCNTYYAENDYDDESTYTYGSTVYSTKVESGGDRGGTANEDSRAEADENSLLKGIGENEDTLKAEAIELLPSTELIGRVSAALGVSQIADVGSGSPEAPLAAESEKSDIADTDASLNSFGTDVEEESTSTSGAVKDASIEMTASIIDVKGEAGTSEQQGLHSQRMQGNEDSLHRTAQPNVKKAGGFKKRFASIKSKVRKSKK